MKKKSFKPGQLVNINLSTRKIEAIILSEDSKKKGFYFLDWTLSGRDKILNTVSVTSEVLSLKKIKKVNNDNFAEQTIEV